MSNHKRVLGFVIGVPVALFVGSAMIAGVIDGINGSPPVKQAPAARSSHAKARATKSERTHHAPAHTRTIPSTVPAKRADFSDAAARALSDRARAQLTSYGFKVRELTILPGSGAARRCPGWIAVLDLYTGNSLESARDRTALGTEILFDQDYDIHRVLATAYQRLEDRGETDNSLYCTETDLGQRPDVLQDYEAPKE